MKQSLPGITAIQYLECKMLPSEIEERAMCGLPVAVYGSLTDICFIGIPTCVTESEYDQQGQSEKSVLSFQTMEILPIRRRLALIIKDVQGHAYLLGHAEPPYPTIKRTGSFGTPAEEKAVLTYEVTLIARKSLVEIAM